MADQVQEPRKPFSVNAGRMEYDGDELFKNSKYCDDFATLDEALAAVERCQGYHFIDLQYVDVKGVRWNLLLEDME